ncbi:hypothetical protein [Gemmata sp.]|uniref:hypothetical protein n=1 Tax=Gemmata sp. TaxID=1914242 RepID=UPI003F6E6996
MAEVLLAYVRYAEGYYRTADGSPASEVKSVKRSLKPVRELYADPQPLSSARGHSRRPSRGTGSCGSAAGTRAEDGTRADQLAQLLRAW